MCFIVKASTKVIIMPIYGNTRGKNKKNEILFFQAETLPVVARGET